MEPIEIVHGAMQGGPLARAIVPEWEWSMNGGNYHTNRDFFTVHWEVQGKDPGVVRLHVEAPRFLDDDYVNNLKGRLVRLLLNSHLRDEVEGAGFLYRVGSRTSDASVANNKSTEAFRVILPVSQRQATVDEDIRAVHDRLGEAVDRIVQEVAGTLDCYFRRE